MTLLKAFEARSLRYTLTAQDEKSIAKQLKKIERKFNKHIIQASKRNKTNIKFTIKHTTNNIYQSQSFRDFVTKMNNLGYSVEWDKVDDYDSYNYTEIKISWKL